MHDAFSPEIPVNDSFCQLCLSSQSQDMTNSLNGQDVLSIPTSFSNVRLTLNLDLGDVRRTIGNERSTNIDVTHSSDFVEPAQTTADKPDQSIE
jgi:hypothetical protein